MVKEFLTQPEKFESNSLKPLKKDHITPFKEEPPKFKNAIDDNAPSLLNANDLFSLFTADIIKEKAVFTR